MQYNAKWIELSKNNQQARRLGYTLLRPCRISIRRRDDAVVGQYGFTGGVALQAPCLRIRRSPGFVFDLNSGECLR